MQTDEGEWFQYLSRDSDQGPELQCLLKLSRHLRT